MNRLCTIAVATAVLLVPATPALAGHGHAKKQKAPAKTVLKLGPKLGLIAAGPYNGSAVAAKVDAVAAIDPVTAPPPAGQTSGFGCSVYIPTDASGSTGEQVETKPNTLDVVSTSQRINQTNGTALPGWGEFLTDTTTCNGVAPAGYYAAPSPGPNVSTFTYYTSCVTHYGFMVSGGAVLTLQSNGQFSFVCAAYAVAPGV